MRDDPDFRLKACVAVALLTAGADVLASERLHQLVLREADALCFVEAEPIAAAEGTRTLLVASSLYGACTAAARSTRCRRLDTHTQWLCRGAGRPLTPQLQALRRAETKSTVVRALTRFFERDWVSSYQQYLYIPNANIVYDTREFPAVVRAHRKADASDHPFCGGTLVGPGAVLTAAHCVESEPDRIVWSCENNRPLNSSSNKCWPSGTWKSDSEDMAHDVALCRVTGLEKCTFAYAAPGGSPGGSQGRTLAFVGNVKGDQGLSVARGTDVEIKSFPSCGPLALLDGSIKPFLTRDDPAVQHRDSGHALYAPSQPAHAEKRWIQGVMSSLDGHYAATSCAHVRSALDLLLANMLQPLDTCLSVPPSQALAALCPK